MCHSPRHSWHQKVTEGPVCTAQGKFNSSSHTWSDMTLNSCPRHDQTNGERRGGLDVSDCHTSDMDLLTCMPCQDPCEQRLLNHRQHPPHSPVPGHSCPHIPCSGLPTAYPTGNSTHRYWGDLDLYRALRRHWSWNSRRILWKHAILYVYLHRSCWYPLSITIGCWISARFPRERIGLEYLWMWLTCFCNIVIYGMSSRPSCPLTDATGNTCFPQSSWPWSSRVSLSWRIGRYEFPK
jgi:hypothetical protein